MNREKYPNYFIVTFLVYALVFVFWFGSFFVPVVSLGAEYGEFYLISVLLLLPLLLFALYTQMSRFQFLWGKENLIRYVIAGITFIDALFALYMSILLI